MQKYKLILKQSERKTISIRINDDLSVTVNAPKYIGKDEIYRFLADKDDWICKHIEQRHRTAIEADNIPIDEALVLKLKRDAKDYFPIRVGHYARILNVTYSKITIRLNVSNWGSCSSKGNLSFNALLMLMPPEVIDYVIVHELCHRLYMNHSASFWNKVAEIIPDYSTARKYLTENGSKYICSLKNLKHDRSPAK